MSLPLVILGVLMACGLAGVALVLALILAIFVARKPPPDARRPDRKPQLFNPAAEDMTLQSADNLRLFSDAQLREIEGQESE